MYNFNQNGIPYPHDYPYDPRTHTFASPGGFHYPALNTQYMPHRDYDVNEYSDPVRRQGPSYMGNQPTGGHEYDPGFQRYGPGDWVPDPRAALGISTEGHSNLAPHNVPHHPPHTSYHLPTSRLDLPLAPSRSVTLDPTIARHHPTPPFSRSPIHFQSAEQTRTSSPRSSRSGRRRTSHANWNETPGSRARVGGPPKAPLGGIGGKPWDERTKSDRVVSTPLPAHRFNTSLKSGNAVANESEPTFKGSPIVFRPPPSTYSPEDSPEPPKSELNEASADEVKEKPIRVSRKEAYPWPIHRPRGSPDSIPLPPSPLEPDPEKGGRRTWTSIASDDIMNPSYAALIKGKWKEVILSIPKQVEVEAQNHMPGLSSARKRELWEAVYLRPEDEKPTTSEEEKQALSGRPSTPPARESPSDVLESHRSPHTPARRGQPNTGQGNSAFVRRQLGGMLRPSSTQSTRTVTSTASVQEGDTLHDKENNRILGILVIDGDDDSRETIGVEGAALTDRRERALVRSVSISPTKEQTQDNPLMSHALDNPPRARAGMLDQDGIDGDTRDEDNKETDEIAGAQRSVRPLESTTSRKHSDTHSTSSPAKRLRPTAKAWEPRSHPSSKSTSTSTLPDTRPVPRLRPTAKVFTPLAAKSLSTPSYLPVGSGVFTFQSDVKPHAAKGLLPASLNRSEPQEVSDAVSEFTRSSQSDMTSMYIGPDDRDAESSPSDIPFDTASSASVSGSHASSLESHSRASDTEEDDDMDLPIPRPFSRSGHQDQVSVQQDRPSSAVLGSPAAELHGIFAESPHASISDDSLFYRRPVSDTSDQVEVLSDSFDPVSYSYETDSESTYEVLSTAVYFTSTPRGGNHVLPIGSVSSSSDHSSDGTDQDLPATAKPGQLQDPRRRFIEWTFPNGHRTMPSIHRRHTFDHMNPDYQEDDVSKSPEPGVASTFASRVGDLRAHLAINQNQSGKSDHLGVSFGPNGLVSTKSSAEFPMRSPSRLLAVINDGPGDKTEQEVEGEERDSRPELTVSAGGLVEGGEIVRRLSEIDTHLVRTIEVLETRDRGYSVDLSPLTKMLEQQSTLISSLASATQQNKGHRNDHFVPLLEGQQAVLEKLSALESGQSELTGVWARFDDRQSEIVGDLRKEVARLNADKEEQMMEIHRLEIELMETRQDRASTEKEADGNRRSFEAALTRIAALQSDLEISQAEKQSLANEIQNNAEQQQRQISIARRHQVDLEAKQEELSIEKRRGESLEETIRLQSSELAELRRSTSKFQETLVDRLSRIEEGVQHSTVGSSDFVMLQQQNQRLHEEVESLRAVRQLAASETKIGRTHSTDTLPELKDAGGEIGAEHKLRQSAIQRAEVAEEVLKQEIAFRAHAGMMAEEHRRSVQLLEAQLQARTKECHHWQTLALTHDRNAYRDYIKSKPARGLEPDVAASSITKLKGRSISTTTTNPAYGTPRTSEAGNVEVQEHKTPHKDKVKNDKAVKKLSRDDSEEWASPGSER